MLQCHVFQYSKKYCNKSENLDQKVELKIQFSLSKSSYFEILLMLEPKQFLHHNEAEYLYFKIRYISTQIVV